MTEPILVPLAEHFHSVQGEGRHTGLPMHFLRFAGCSVGRIQPHQIDPKGTEEYAGFKCKALTVLPNGERAKVCTDYTGSHFFCDTDYNQHEEVAREELVKETWEYVACFTGGEPLMHQGKLWFKALFEALRYAEVAIHVETSGTIIPTLNYDWLTVSPKEHWLPEVVQAANQVKFLVDPSHDSESFICGVAKYLLPDCEVYLSPIFDPNNLVQANLDYALELLREYPGWHLGCQWHKFLGVR